jgi:hypothetical protein
MKLRAACLLLLPTLFCARRIEPVRYADILGLMYASFLGQKQVFVVNNTSRTVSMFHYNPAGGLITDTGQVATTSIPIGAAVHPGGRFLYVTQPGNGSVMVFFRSRQLPH